MISKHFKWLSVVVLAAGVGSLAQAVPPGSADEIRARTAPVGELCRAGSNCAGQLGGAQTGVATTGAEGGAMSGEQIYSQFCFACHATGVTNAPRLGNAEDWAPRVAKGMDVLMASTINGLNVMPARGTCMACSDDELRAAVDYLLESAQ